MPLILCHMLASLIRLRAASRSTYCGEHSSIFSRSVAHPLCNATRGFLHSRKPRVLFCCVRLSDYVRLSDNARLSDCVRRDVLSCGAVVLDRALLSAACA